MAERLWLALVDKSHVVISDTEFAVTDTEVSVSLTPKLGITVDFRCRRHRNSVSQWNFGVTDTETQYHIRYQIRVSVSVTPKLGINSWVSVSLTPKLGVADTETKVVNQATGNGH